MQKSNEEVESDNLQLVGWNANEKHGPVEIGDLQTPNDQTRIIPVVVWECEETDTGWDILLSDLVQWDGRWSTIYVCEDSVGSSIYKPALKGIRVENEPKFSNTFGG